jgi:hypothetical protein
MNLLTEKLIKLYQKISIVLISEVAIVKVIDTKNKSKIVRRKNTYEGKFACLQLELL